MGESASGAKDCLIVGMFSRNETPYAQHYISVLNELNMSYDVVYFERYDESAQPNDNELLYVRYCPTGGSKLKKLGPMIGYAKFVRSVLSRGTYRTVIVLTTLPGLVLQGILLKNYCGRYLFDIRDYTHEENSWYLKQVTKLVEGSSNTVLSARGFLRFLPQSEKYVFTHNIGDGFTAIERDVYFKNAPLSVGFVGSVRYPEVNCPLISQFESHTEYQLHYFGTETAGCDLKRYCAENECTRPVFHGPFNNSDKPALYQQVDIINSIYGDYGLETTSAVPNRFYDAALYKCPIIVSKGTYLEELVEQYHLGFAVDIKTEDVPGRLDEYIESFSREQFEAGCNKLLEDVSMDLREQRDAVKRLLLQA